MRSGGRGQGAGARGLPFCQYSLRLGFRDSRLDLVLSGFLHASNASTWDPSTQIHGHRANWHDGNGRYAVSSHFFGSYIGQQSMQNTSKLRNPQSRSHEVGALVLQNRRNGHTHLVLVTVPSTAQSNKHGCQLTGVVGGKCNVVTARMLKKVSRAPSMRHRWSIIH